MPAWKDKNTPRDRSHIGLRKRLRRGAERKHRAPMQWAGGILYFAGSKDEVPGIEHVPKPGRSAIGWDGAQPVPTIQVDRLGKRASGLSDRPVRDYATW
ncbi:hypothetical protein H7X87_03935 [Acetobacteraceae bacterium]|nr:hypothetical protein [Candidatus Parcubacteria bacterium]